MRPEWQNADREKWAQFRCSVSEALIAAGVEAESAWLASHEVEHIVCAPRFDPEEDNVTFFARMVRERTELLEAVRLVQKRLFIHRHENYAEGRIYRQMREPLDELRRRTKDDLAASLIKQAEIGRPRKGAPPSDLHRKLQALLRCWNAKGLAVGASEPLRRFLLVAMEPIWHTRKLPDTFPEHVLKRGITEWNRRHRPGQKPGNPAILEKPPQE